jgi:hypothetical protein
VASQRYGYKLPPAIRAAARWAWVDELAMALFLFCDELMVRVGSAVLSVPVELIGVELVVFVVVKLVVGVVEVVGLK